MNLAYVTFKDRLVESGAREGTSFDGRKDVMPPWRSQRRSALVGGCSPLATAEAAPVSAWCGPNKLRKLYRVLAGFPGFHGTRCRHLISLNVRPRQLRGAIQSLEHTVSGEQSSGPMTCPGTSSAMSGSCSGEHPAARASVLWRHEGSHDSWSQVSRFGPVEYTDSVGYCARTPARKFP